MPQAAGVYENMKNNILKDVKISVKVKAKSYR